MFEVALEPGVGFGPFRVGEPLFAVLPSLMEEFGAKKPLDLKYDKKHPPTKDIVVQVHDYGVLLRFSPLSQMCTTVELYDVRRVSLVYKGKVLSSSTVPPSLQRALEIMGPAKPGNICWTKRTYSIVYPNAFAELPMTQGLVLAFDVPEAELQKIARHPTRIPDVLSDGTSPLLVRATVAHPGGSDYTNIHGFPSAAKEILADPHQGITFKEDGITIKFGTSLQELIGCLGQPAGRFDKSDNRISIYRGQLAREGLDTNHGGEADYFLNYFSLGLDFLMCGLTHTVKKIILHSNAIEHPDFGAYMPANFRLVIPPLNGNGEGQVIDPSMRYDQIRSLDGNAAVVVRSEGRLPFGQLRLFAFRGVCLEVVKNGSIATITIFHADSEELFSRKSALARSNSRDSSGDQRAPRLLESRSASGRSERSDHESDDLINLDSAETFDRNASSASIETHAWDSESPVPRAAPRSQYLASPPIEEEALYRRIRLQSGMSDESEEELGEGTMQQTPVPAKDMKSGTDGSNSERTGSDSQSCQEILQDKGFSRAERSKHNEELCKGKGKQNNRVSLKESEDKVKESEDKLKESEDKVKSLKSSEVASKKKRIQSQGDSAREKAKDASETSAGQHLEHASSSQYTNDFESSSEDDRNM